MKKKASPYLGRRLLAENLQDGRAAYGERILATVSRELTEEFGGGFGYATVNRAIQFAQFFPDPAIVSALSTQLSWSHFIELLPIKDPLARDLYAEMCHIERWDVRTLRQNIGGMLFQRTDGGLFEPAVLNSPKLSPAVRVMQPQANRHCNDTYLLKFLALTGRRQRLAGTAICRRHSGQMPLRGAAI